MFVPRAKRHLWEEARELRREGWSLREVARWLDVALSSVSVWTRGVVSSPAPRSPAPSVVVGPEQEEAPRWCSRCASHRPATDFNRFAGGRQGWCRACFKRYYAEGRARHRSRNNALKAQRVMEAQQLVFDHLSGRACVDCGEPDPVVLEFDHVGPKRCEVSTLVRRGVRPAVLRLDSSGATSCAPAAIAAGRHFGPDGAGSISTGRAVRGDRRLRSATSATSSRRSPHRDAPTVARVTRASSSTTMSARRPKG
jgi:hypothetical protein